MIALERKALAFERFAQRIDLAKQRPVIETRLIDLCCNVNCFASLKCLYHGRITMKKAALSVSCLITLLTGLGGCGGDDPGSTAAGVSTVREIAAPQFHFRTSGLQLAGQGPGQGLSPAQVISHYSITGDGSGQSIAIVDAGDDSTIEADLAKFNTQFGLPACTAANGCFHKIYASGQQPSNLGWSTEIALDVEWAHAIAPGAHIVLVEAASAYDNDLQVAVDVAARIASVVSMSWGIPEYQGETAVDPTFNVQHVTFVAAAGDTGDVREYPAASPYVVAVGGTSLKATGDGTITETAWSQTGGGPSLYESMPVDQMTFGVFSNAGRRAIPDVGYNADPRSGYSIYDSASSGWVVVGGTSAGAPQWAALVAIADAKRARHGKPALGTTGAALYFAGRQGKAASAIDGSGFVDVTSGADGSCGINCQAHSGFDDLTGLGVPDATALVSSLSAYPS